MSAVKTYPGTLYDYTAGTYCGVLVTESVMRKLAALQAQHLEAVRRLLTDSEGSVFPSMWTLHHPGGEQTTVHFIETSASVGRRIEMATHAAQPRACFPVFIASGISEAKEMADARYAEQSVTP